MLFMLFNNLNTKQWIMKRTVFFCAASYRKKKNLRFSILLHWIFLFNIEHVKLAVDLKVFMVDRKKTVFRNCKHSPRFYLQIRRSLKYVHLLAIKINAKINNLCFSILLILNFRYNSEHFKFACNFRGNGLVRCVPL